jgi:hypothetical protein
MKPVYVDPEKAAAIEALADQCELSISEVVTIAIDHWYGDPPARPRPRQNQGPALTASCRRRRSAPG